MKIPNLFQNIEANLNLPVIFSILYIYGGVFSGIRKVPVNLVYLFKNYPFLRYLGLISLAYSATKELEYALLSSLLFLIIIHLIRTPQERKEFIYII